MKDHPHPSDRTVRQVEAIADGTVIDHIPPAVTLRVAALIAARDDQVFIGINLKSKRGLKGVVKVAGKELDRNTIARLALIAPQATVSIIRDYAVISKSTVPLPEYFSGIARCPNPNCVTNHERSATRFETIGRDPLLLRCCHCERRLHADELTLVVG